jgi:hypothetical protein
MTQILSGSAAAIEAQHCNLTKEPRTALGRERSIVPLIMNSFRSDRGHSYHEQAPNHQQDTHDSGHENGHCQIVRFRLNLRHPRDKQEES